MIALLKKTRWHCRNQQTLQPRGRNCKKTTTPNDSEQRTLDFSTCPCTRTWQKWLLGKISKYSLALSSTGYIVYYSTKNSRGGWGWGKSIQNSTCPKLPHILAWMEGYICFSFIVIVISLSRIAVTRWRRASSLCLQKRTRFNNQGVIYSRQRCFNSIPEIQITKERHIRKESCAKALSNYLLEQSLEVIGGGGRSKMY